MQTKSTIDIILAVHHFICIFFNSLPNSCYIIHHWSTQFKNT